MSVGTILLVDDEAHIVELARMYLEKEGFEVRSAGDGHRADAAPHGRLVYHNGPVGFLYRVDDGVDIQRRERA